MMGNAPKCNVRELRNEQQCGCIFCWPSYWRRTRRQARVHRSWRRKKINIIWWFSASKRTVRRRDERMAMIVLDQIEFLIVFWGALKAGVTPFPSNTLLSTEIYNGILKDSRPSCVMVSKELWDTVSPALDDIDCIRHIIVIGNTPENTTTQRDHTVHWATAHQLLKRKYPWITGQSCTNNQFGPVRWGCSRCQTINSILHINR